MFKRYTEKTRRVIFFAGYEAGLYGSSSIESEHLLLGVMREDRAPIRHTESIRKELESHSTIRERTSTSLERPLSHECKRILKFAAQEAKRLGHKQVGTEHLLLGIRQEDQCLAARILKGRESTTRAKEWCCADFRGVAISQANEKMASELSLSLEHAFNWNTTVRIASRLIL